MFFTFAENYFCWIVKRNTFYWNVVRLSSYLKCVVNWCKEEGEETGICIERSHPTWVKERRATTRISNYHKFSESRTKTSFVPQSSKVYFDYVISSTKLPRTRFKIPRKSSECFWLSRVSNQLAIPFHSQWTQMWIDFPTQKWKRNLEIFWCRRQALVRSL